MKKLTIVMVLILSMIGCTQAPAPITAAPVEETEAPAAPTEAPVVETEAPVAETEALAEPTEAPLAEEKYTIGLSMPEIKGSFWISIYYGVTDEAAKLGMDVIAVEAGGFQNVDKQISQIEDLITRGVDIILVGATSAEGVVPVLEEAIDAGIPVIGLSSLPATDKLVSKIGADHYTMGKMLAQCGAEKLGGTGKVAMASGPSGVIWATLRSKGFHEEMANSFPDMEIVAEQNTPTGRDQGVTLTEDWLQAFPDLNMIYAATDDIGAGAADALASAGNTDVIVVTANLSPIGREYLMSGKILCEAVQQIVLQGREGVRQAKAYLDGETVEPMVITEVLLVTADNIDEVDLSEFQAPADFVPEL